LKNSVTTASPVVEPDDPVPDEERGQGGQDGHEDEQARGFQMRFPSPQRTIFGLKCSVSGVVHVTVGGDDE